MHYIFCQTLLTIYFSKHAKIQWFISRSNTTLDGAQMNQSYSGFVSSYVINSTIASFVGCPNARHLIWCKLKMTVSAWSAFIFSEFSHFNLKFGTRQYKIVWKFPKEWLLKTKILGPVDEQMTRFFRKMHQFKTATLLYQSSLKHKHFMKLKKTQLFYLVFNTKLTQAFCCTKGLYEVEN